MGKNIYRIFKNTFFVLIVFIALTIMISDIGFSEGCHKERPQGQPYDEDDKCAPEFKTKHEKGPAPTLCENVDSYNQQLPRDGSDCCADNYCDAQYYLAIYGTDQETGEEVCVGVERSTLYTGKCEIQGDSNCHKTSEEQEQEYQKLLKECEAACDTKGMLTAGIGLAECKKGCPAIAKAQVKPICACGASTTMATNFGKCKQDEKETQGDETTPPGGDPPIKPQNNFIMKKDKPKPDWNFYKDFEFCNYMGYWEDAGDLPEFTNFETLEKQFKGESSPDTSKPIYVIEGDCKCGFYFFERTFNETDIKDTLEQFLDKGLKGTNVNSDYCFNYYINPYVDSKTGQLKEEFQEPKIVVDEFGTRYMVGYYDFCINSQSNEEGFTVNEVESVYDDDLKPDYSEGYEIPNNPNTPPPDRGYYLSYGPCGHQCQMYVVEIDEKGNPVEKEEQPEPTEGTETQEDENELESPMPGTGVYFGEHDEVKEDIKKREVDCNLATTLDNVCYYPLVCVKEDGTSADPDCNKDIAQTFNVYKSKEYCNLLKSQKPKTDFAQNLDLSHMDCSGIENIEVACGYSKADLGSLPVDFDNLIKNMCLYSSRAQEIAQLIEDLKFKDDSSKKKPSKKENSDKVTAEEIESGKKTETKEEDPNLATHEQKTDLNISYKWVNFSYGFNYLFYSQKNKDHFVFGGVLLPTEGSYKLVNNNGDTFEFDVEDYVSLICGDNATEESYIKNPFPIDELEGFSGNFGEGEAYPERSKVKKNLFLLKPGVYNLIKDGKDISPSFYCDGNKKLLSVCLGDPRIKAVIEEKMKIDSETSSQTHDKRDYSYENYFLPRLQNGEVGGIYDETSTYFNYGNELLFSGDKIVISQEDENIVAYCSQIYNKDPLNVEIFHTVLEKDIDFEPFSFFLKDMDDLKTSFVPIEKIVSTSKVANEFSSGCIEYSKQSPLSRFSYLPALERTSQRTNDGTSAAGASTGNGRVRPSNSQNTQTTTSKTTTNSKFATCCGDDAVNDKFLGESYFSCYNGRLYVESEVAYDSSYSLLDLKGKVSASSHVSEHFSVPESYLKYPYLTKINYFHKFNFYLDDDFMECMEENVNDVNSFVRDYFPDTTKIDYLFCSENILFRGLKLFENLTAGDFGNFNYMYNEDTINSDLEIVETDKVMMLSPTNIEQVSLGNKVSTLDEVGKYEVVKLSALKVSDKNNFLGLIINTTLTSDSYAEEYNYILDSNDVLRKQITSNSEERNYLTAGVCGYYEDYCKDENTLFEFYLDLKGNCVKEEINCEEKGYMMCSLGACYGSIKGNEFVSEKSGGSDQSEVDEDGNGIEGGETSEGSGNLERREPPVEPEVEPEKPPEETPEETNVGEFDENGRPLCCCSGEGKFITCSGVEPSTLTCPRLGQDC